MLLPNLSTTTTEALPLDAFTVALNELLEFMVNGTEKFCILTKDVFMRLVPVMVRIVFVVPTEGFIPETLGFW